MRKRAIFANFPSFVSEEKNLPFKIALSIYFYPTYLGKTAEC